MAVSYGDPIGPKVRLVLLLLLTAFATNTAAAAVDPYNHCWRWGYCHCCFCLYCCVYSLLPAMLLQLVQNTIGGTAPAAAAPAVGTVAQHRRWYCCCSLAAFIVSRKLWRAKRLKRQAAPAAGAVLQCKLQALSAFWAVWLPIGNGHHTKPQTLLLLFLLVTQ